MSRLKIRACATLQKLIWLTAVICFFAVFLTGCDGAPEPEPITGTTLSVMEDGVIRYYLVEDFDRDYYSVTELNNMIQGEIKEYNSRLGTGGEASLRVDSVELLAGDGSKVVVEFMFSSPDVYKKYSGMDLFYGTVSEALAEGYQFGDLMVDASDGTTAISEATISDSGNRHILIMEKKFSDENNFAFEKNTFIGGGMRIIFPNRVLYISKGATIHNDGTVTASPEEGYTYVITR